MSSLIVLIMLVFLAIGAAYGIGAKTITSMVDGINAVTKTFAGLSDDAALRSGGLDRLDPAVSRLGIARAALWAHLAGL